VDPIRGPADKYGWSFATAGHFGDARQKSSRPGGASVGRGGEAYAGGTDAIHSPDLKRANQRRAISEDVRLDFRGMLASGVGECIAAELFQSDLRRSRRERDKRNKYDERGWR